MRELTPRTITVNSSARAEWLVIALLIVLSAVPVGAGAVRLAQLTGGAEITPENARFFAAPLPVVLHILSASLFCILGAFQFAPGIRRRRPGRHRAAGRLVVPAGLVAALSGLWLTHFYPPVMGDGPLLYGLRLVVGSAMTLFIRRNMRVKVKVSERPVRATSGRVDGIPRYRTDRRKSNAPAARGGRVGRVLREGKMRENRPRKRGRLKEVL